MLKGSVAVFLPAVMVALTPALTSAQPSDSPTSAGALTPADVARIKEELREEVKAELREELREALKDDLKAEMKNAGAESSADDSWSDSSAGESWAEEEWKWEEPATPELNFFEIDGYFRFRYDMFNNLDLGTYYRDTRDTDDVNDDFEYGPFAPGFAPPTPLCNTDVRRRPGGAGENDLGADSCANRSGISDTLGGANMRLRLEPTLNVYEDIKIRAQIDVLDNIILGSTPETLVGNPNAPISVLSNGQVAPVDGINSVWADSIRVKRVWAEVMTPLGQLRVGRMPNHFGMGMTDNDGRGLDTDFGDSVDRILFATKIGDFYVIPAFDWAATGPTSAIRLQPFGQPFDREQRDDVDQYTLSIIRRDTDEEVRRKLENDQYVLNYGVRVSGRFQALDAASFFTQGNVEGQANTEAIVNRDSQLLLYSVWAKFIRRNLTVEAEHAGVWGTIGNAVTGGTFGAQDPQEVDVAQFGGSVKVSYRLLKDALTLELLLLAASGDSAPGWGLQPLRDPSLSRPGIW
ncbi:MAG: TIGR04551 family protein, partial [Myxococcota bacterium]